MPNDSETIANLRESFERAWVGLLREQQKANGTDNPSTLAAMRIAFAAGWHAAIKEIING